MGVHMENPLILRALKGQVGGLVIRVAKCETKFDRLIDRIDQRENMNECKWREIGLRHGLK